MKTVGIIMEANPLHNGHAYFINKIKSLLMPEVLVCLTSTNFTMRGEVSTISKVEKVEALLDIGVDFVLEFPLPLSLQSGNYFASNGVEILASFGITDLCCGCETEDISIFYYFDKVIQSDEFKQYWESSHHLSYKMRYSEVFKKMNVDPSLIELFNSPNFTLAFQYFLAINKNHPQINFHLIKRSNDYYGKDLNSTIISATQVRSLIENNLNVDLYIPVKQRFVDVKKANDLLFYQAICKYYLNINISNSHDDCYNYMIKNLKMCDSYTDFNTLLPNKSFTLSRLRRNLLYFILDISKKHHDIKYIRLLGYRLSKIEYIHNLSKERKELIFSNKVEKVDTKVFEIYQIEKKATLLYSLITDKKISKEKLLEEYKYPIRKE